MAATEIKLQGNPHSAAIRTAVTDEATIPGTLILRWTVLPTRLTFQPGLCPMREITL